MKPCDVFVTCSSIAAGGTVSLSSLFLAGFVSGVLTGLCLMVAAYMVAVRRGYARDAFPGWRALAVAFAAALPGLITAVIIAGGVLSGVFTATESSAIAVIYAILVAALLLVTYVPAISMTLPNLVR